MSFEDFYSNFVREHGVQYQELTKNMMEEAFKAGKSANEKRDDVVELFSEKYPYTNSYEMCYEWLEPIIDGDTIWYKFPHANHDWTFALIDTLKELTTTSRHPRFCMERPMRVGFEKND